MSPVALCSYRNNSLRLANEQEANALDLNLSKLYFPHRFESTAVSELSENFGRWSIVVDLPQKGTSRHITIREYCDMLAAEELPASHKETIFALSMSPKAGCYRSAIEYFDLARFCEMRAALGALRLRSVEAVRVTERNSGFDRSKADLLIAREGREEPQPLQVKAKAGKAHKIASSVPILRNVWELRFSELVRVLQDMLEPS